jgi:transposase-like protein
MNLIEFYEQYGTEEKCRESLFKSRWPEGFVCPRCGHREYFDIKSRKLFQCKACRYQASVTAGTIMDKSKTPLVKWFTAIYLMSKDKRGISALALKKKIGVAYQTAWSMCQKIRYAMGKRDEAYLLGGIVEMDEAFFGSPTEGGKRGRGTDKTAVLVSVSLTDEGKPNYVKMQVLDSVDGASVRKFANTNVAKGSEIRTDGLNIYASLAKDGYNLVQKTYDPENDPAHLHWTHILISNAKRIVDGTFHGLDSIHLQRYLDEYCYRFNRRWFENNLFRRAVVACAMLGKACYYELIG